MAVTAGVVGAGMIAAGTAAAIAAQRQKTKARGVKYGGTQEAQDALKQTYAQGADQGNQAYGQGTTLLQRGGSAGYAQTAAGQQIANRANAISTLNANKGQATSLLNAYQPGAVAEAQTREVLDQNARANLGAAANGGALGLRNAVNANAMAGVQAAGALATQRAQEEQALLGAKVAQLNNDQQTMNAQNALAEQQRMSYLGLGNQVAAQGNQQVLSAGSGIGQLGLANQGQFLQQQQNVYDTQNDNDLDYERRRQADQQRKAQNWAQFGQTLVAGGANIVGKAAG